MSNITIDRVSRVFTMAGNAPVMALGEVSLEITHGEFVLLLGPSGCGKSTLLRLIANLDRATTGSININGLAGRKGFERVGIVFQHAALLPWLTVLENVLYPARAISFKRAKEYRTRAHELLDMVGLSAAVNRYPSEISGGQQQRAGICRALLLDPEILLMDEPFSALDALTREELQLELLRIHAATGKTIVFVTHSIAEAILLSSKIVVMASAPGRIAEVIDTELPGPRSLDSIRSERAEVLDQRIRNLICGRGCGEA